MKGECVCVCVCVCERERERERYPCIKGACVCIYVCMCVCVREREQGAPVPDWEAGRCADAAAPACVPACGEWPLDAANSKNIGVPQYIEIPRRVNKFRRQVRRAVFLSCREARV